MTSYKGYLPANARILISYEQGQEVLFSYPIEWTYWQAVWRRGFMTVLNAWLIFHYLLAVPLAAYLSLKLLYQIFVPEIIVVEAHTTVLGGLDNAIVLLSGLLYFIGIPAAVTFILALKKGWIAAVLPKLGYYTALVFGHMYEKEFTAVDVSENKLIIPFFHNVFLKYEAEGGFNAALLKVEIYELPFELTKYRFGVRTYKKHNDYFYSAIFSFKGKPADGRLKVRYI